MYFCFCYFWDASVFVQFLKLNAILDIYICEPNYHKISEMDQEDKQKLKAQNDTLRQLCLNRKKQNFQALKQWDQIRAHKLTTHRKVADEIDDALQTRISESDQFLRVVMQFLSDLDTQQVPLLYHSLQKKYEAQLVSTPETKLQANSVSRNIHITTSQWLMRMYKNTQNFKGHKKIRNSLEESVKNIENLLTESERDIMEIRTKIELKAVEIQNQNGLTIQKCDELVLVNKQTSNKSLNSETDLFQIQNQFLQQTLAQTRTQQTYGEAVVELLKCVQNYQKQKLQLTRDCLQKYLLALSQCGEESPEAIKSMLDILEKRTQDEILHIFYSSQEFLSRDIMKDIIKAECKDENSKLDLQNILNFLTKITYHAFDCRNLILKQYKTYLKPKKPDPSQQQKANSNRSSPSGGHQQLQNSYLIITVDAYLHLYIYKDQFQLLEQKQKPQYTIKCNNNIEMTREGDIGLMVVVKKWAFMNLGKGKGEGEGIGVVFLSEDQREEFLEFFATIVM